MENTNRDENGKQYQPAPPTVEGGPNYTFGFPSRSPTVYRGKMNRRNILQGISLSPFFALFFPKNAIARAKLATDPWDAEEPSLATVTARFREGEMLRIGALDFPYLHNMTYEGAPTLVELGKTLRGITLAPSIFHDVTVELFRKDGTPWGNVHPAVKLSAYKLFKTPERSIHEWVVWCSNNSAIRDPSLFPLEDHVFIEQRNAALQDLAEVKVTFFFFGPRRDTTSKGSGPYMETRTDMKHDG